MSKRWLVPLSVALLSLVGRPARASLVLAKAGGDVHASEARVALSSSEKRTVTFEQLVLDEARGELAWVIAVPKGGWIEGADAHVFESLDEATAPVIAPAKSLGCAPTAREATAEPRSAVAPRTISKVEFPVAANVAATRLNALGFVVDEKARGALAALAVAGEDVAIVVLPAGPRGETRVVRVLGPPGRPFPSILGPTAGVSPRLRAWLMAPTRVRLAGLPHGEIDPARLTWSAGRSNFRTLLDETLAKDGLAVTFAGIDGVFVDQASGTAASIVPSWTRQYFGAWDSGGTAAAWACASRVSGLSTRAQLISLSCPKSPPWFSTEPVPGCLVPPAGELAPSEFSCGALDDLAVAAGGLSPSRTFLTRLDGVLAPTATGLPLEPVGLGSIPSFREATLGECGSSGGSSGGSTGSPPSTGAPPSDDDAGLDPTGSSGSGGSGSSSDGCSTTVGVIDSCTRTSQSSDSCSGSSSSSSDSCGGSSSSSSESCSGASSSADDGCSSGSSSSGACSGAAGAADDGCRVTRARPRVRFSALIYSLIAVATVLRRLGRRSAQGRSDA